MSRLSTKVEKRINRKKRSNVFGTKDRPRLSFFKSNTNVYAQFIDDENGRTMLGGSTLKIKEGTRSEKAERLGGELGKKALDMGIKEVVFDRGGFVYTGIVASFADACRKAGVKF